MYKCRRCKKVITIQRYNYKQKVSYKNVLILLDIVNTMPVKRICEREKITKGIFYSKLDFLYKRCCEFIGQRERRLMNGLILPRANISVDQQQYMVNWSNRDDKRNVALYGIASAERLTGYVLGVNVNYDPDINFDDTEEEAINCGDYDIPYAFRKYARVWLKDDYNDSIKSFRPCSPEQELYYQSSCPFGFGNQRWI